jgi:hypothetical protein
MTAVHHHTQSLLVKIGISGTSPSWVARITGVNHHAWQIIHFEFQLGLISPMNIKTLPMHFSLALVSHSSSHMFLSCRQNLFHLFPTFPSLPPQSKTNFVLAWFPTSMKALWAQSPGRAQKRSAVNTCPMNKWDPFAGEFPVSALSISASGSLGLPHPWVFWIKDFCIYYLQKTVSRTEKEMERANGVLRCEQNM